MHAADKAVRQKILAEIVTGYAAMVDGPGCFFVEDWVEMYPDTKVFPRSSMPLRTQFWSAVGGPWPSHPAASLAWLCEWLHRQSLWQATYVLHDLLRSQDALRGLDE